MDLPLEILIQILSHVDPLTLRTTPQVCKLWHDILNDDAVWMAIFKLTFPFSSTKGFSSIARSHNYRNELLIRSHILHEYHKGRTTSQGYFISPSSHSVQLATGAPVPVPLRANTLPVRTSESLHVDWSKNKLMVLDIPQDTLISCQLRNGKTSNAVQDFVPEGVTCFDWNPKFVAFGRWNNSLADGFIDYKGLLLSKIHVHDHNEQLNRNRSRITSVAICQSNEPTTSIVQNQSMNNNNKKLKFINHSPVLAPVSNNLIIGKSGKINTFTSDESGEILGWDVRSGDVIWSYNFPIGEQGTQIRKLASDGKSILIVILDNGEIWSIDGIFDKNSDEVSLTKVGRFNTENGMDNKRIHIDYGGGNIIIWNEIEVLVFSFTHNSVDHSEARRYIPPDGLLISHLSIEDNGKIYTPRDESIVGNDPLLTAVCLNNGNIHVINTRDSEWDMIPVSIITPHFLSENDSFQIEILDDRISQVASVAINSLVVVASNHLGKVEIFDVMTGSYLRTALSKLSMTRLNQLSHFIREQGGNVLKIDERGSRGVLIIGSYVQYFCFGEDVSFIDQQKRNKKGKNKSKSSMNTIKNNLDDYEYQLEFDELNLNKRLNNIEKFNGTQEDDDHELQMAMAMSLSLNNSQVELPVDTSDDQRRDTDDEEEIMKRALELSLREASTSDIPYEDDVVEDEVVEYDEMDNDLRLAIELSKREMEEDEWQPLT